MIDTRPLKGDRWVRRRRSCLKCGLRWKTYEKVAPDPEFSFHNTTGSQQAPPLIDGDHTTSSDVTTQPVAKSALISDLDPISSPLSKLPDPDLTNLTKLQVDPERARVRPGRRKKGEPFTFAPDFLAFWFAIESNRPKGSKAEAFERWAEEKAPSSEALIAKWREYQTSLGDSFAVDVCRWLAKRRWEEEYGPAPTARRSAPDTRCAWHRDPRHDGSPSFRPSPGCDRCKHFSARDAGRNSESPTHAAGAAPSWATSPPPAAWTPEQIAEAEQLRKTAAGRNGT